MVYMDDIQYIIRGRPGLTLRQNKHVLRASRGKGTPQKSDHNAIYFISQILGSKCRKNGFNPALIRGVGVDRKVRGGKL
jgi:hypothetical protein